jgi:triacylglycerol lipase
MLARLQIFLCLALLVTAIVWAFGFFAFGHPVWAVGGALLILLSYALFLGIEFTILHFVQKADHRTNRHTNDLINQAADAVPHATFSQLLRAWWGEVIAAPQVFLWRQPFRSNAQPDYLPAGSLGKQGVVLVHGLVCNRGLWNPWMAELRQRGVPFVAVNLEPVFGSIDRYVSILEAAVGQVEVATGKPVLLVGHSMGGLAIRAWLNQAGEQARMRHAITVGSPHCGTWLARFTQTANGEQMRLGSAWLKKLAAAESADRYANFTCFFGHCDNIVFPVRCATLPGAKNCHIPTTAHVHMLFQQVVFDEVCRWCVVK